MNSQKTIRSFLAIPLDQKTRQQLVKQQTDCRKRLGVDDIIWSSPNNFHITLCFFGNINGHQINDLSDQLTTIAMRQPSLSLTIEPPAPFPSLKKAQIIAARVNGDEQFSHLIKAVNIATNKAHIQIDSRPFKGHITLGRYRQRHDPDPTETPLSDHPSINMRANTMVLFQSELTHNGPIHTALAHFQLNG